MPIAQALADFKAGVLRCDNLIANAHKLDANGSPFMPEIDRQQVTVAAFLNFFIAWESFLETTLAELLRGSPTMNGAAPVKYASPPDTDSAKKMVIGTILYFDYGNQEKFRKIAEIYFRNGEPFQPHLNAIFTDLQELRTMRNSSAHISSSTQTALEGLSLRLLARPSPGITLYQLLTAQNPQSAGQTVFETYKAKLIVTAELIAQG